MPITGSFAPPAVQVTCQLCIDNYIYSVYVDGEEVDNPGDCNGYVTFMSDAKAMGVYGADAECGCNCGSFTMWCETADGTSEWHQYSTQTNDNRILSRGSKSNANLITGGDFSSPDYVLDSNWQEQDGRQGGHTLSDMKYGTQGVCGKENKGGNGAHYWWFRIDPRA